MSCMAALHNCGAFYTPEARLALLAKRRDVTTRSHAIAHAEEDDLVERQHFLKFLSEDHGGVVGTLGERDPEEDDPESTYPHQMPDDDPMQVRSMV